MATAQGCSFLMRPYGKPLVEPSQDSPQTQGRRRIWISLGIAFALLLIFHQPLLLGALHWFAVYEAAKQNLHLDFRAEGNVFGELSIRNLHIVPTGPAAVEAADADYIHAEYDLWALLRGRNDFLEAVELRNARIVIDPAKVRVKAAPRPHEKVTLPAVFPERARLDDVTVIVRDPAHDLVAEHFSIELNPRVASTLSLAFLQLPTGEAWKRITGATSYQQRNLVLRDVILNEQTRFNLLELDASHIRDHALGLRLDAVLDNAPLHVQALLREEARSLLITAHADATQLALASAKRLGVLSAQDVDGTVETFSFDGAGLLSAPRSWVGRGGGTLRDLRAGGISVDRIDLQLSAQDGIAAIRSAEIKRGAATVQLRGSTQLPEKASEMGRSPARFEIASNDLDLALLTSAMTSPIAGHASVNGSIEIRDQRLSADMQVKTGALAAAGAKVADCDIRILANKSLTEENVPWFHGLATTVSLRAAAASFAYWEAQSVSLQVEQRENQSSWDGTVGGRDDSSVTLQGGAILRPEAKEFSQQPATLELSVNARQVRDFQVENAADPISGALLATASLRWSGKVLDGSFNAFGSQLQYRTLRVAQLNLAGAVAQSRVFLNDLTANLNERDFARAQGSFDLRGDGKFQGSAAVDLADLSALQPVLAPSGIKSELAGPFVLNWQGSGSPAKALEQGSLKLTWKNGRFGNMKALQANVDATYSPAGLEIPTLFLGSDRMDLQAIISSKENTLTVSKIQIDQGNAKFAVGDLSMPFTWANVGTREPVFPRDGPVNATFQSQNLDLRKLTDDLGLPPLVTGLLNLQLQANGTLSDVRAHAEVDARDLRNAKLTNLDPATFRLSIDAAQQKISVVGQVKQSRIQPIEIAATAPLDLGKTLREGWDDNAPLHGSVRLPRSSVNFLRQFVPAVEQLDGDVALNVNIDGTIQNPVLSGDGDIRINAARFTDATLPVLRGFQSRLSFRGDTLAFERFHGDLAGGPFTLGGRIIFTKLTEPTVDLDLRAQSILLARNDTLTVRADANLKVTGPFAAATVRGTVGLTDSHFLKNIDLIPIGLPGRPAPQPLPEDRPDFSLPDPPLRDCKFDVAITTKDPFSIRGNLATGGAIANLHLGGTGFRPELRGTVRLENLEATLPFSRLEVTNGFLYFDPSDSFNPKIDLQGTSLIRDYTIRVYVYGSSLAPQAIFSSEPPLPQEEIISLLATGATRQELTGNSNVLAGRAASLLVQQLYRKFFKKGQPTHNDSVFDRLQLDLGAVDPRTGQQQASARFKLNQNLVLVGDVGIGGEFRGLVKYLIRFH